MLDGIQLPGSIVIHMYSLSIYFSLSKKHFCLEVYLSNFISYVLLPIYKIE